MHRSPLRQPLCCIPREESIILLRKIRLLVEWKIAKTWRTEHARTLQESNVQAVAAEVADASSRYTRSGGRAATRIPRNAQKGARIYYMHLSLSSHLQLHSQIVHLGITMIYSSLRSFFSVLPREEQIRLIPR